MDIINIQEKLQAPFDSVSYRVQSYTICGGGKAIILRYIDARDVQDRLDTVLGIDGWKTEYREVSGLLLCRIYYRTSPDSDWSWKEDTGTESQTQKEKGHVSDAFKRSAVQLGIGRYLYRNGTLLAHAIIKSTNKDTYVIDSSGKRVYDLDTHMRALDPLYGGVKINMWDKVNIQSTPTPSQEPGKQEINDIKKILKGVQKEAQSTELVDILARIESRYIVKSYHIELIRSAYEKAKNK